MLALLVARDEADNGAPDVTLGSSWTNGAAPISHLGADARVAETADGRIVGYAAMSREVTMLVVVAPDHEGRGIVRASASVRNSATACEEARATASGWPRATSAPAGC
jgi:hypothetical protein